MFKVGDKVVCNSTVGDAYKVFELRGIVVHIVGVRVGVDWGEYVGGHDCDRRCTPGFGWYVDYTDLRKVIVFKGNK